MFKPVRIIVMLILIGGCLFTLKTQYDTIVNLNKLEESLNKQQEALNKQACGLGIMKYCDDK